MRYKAGAFWAVMDFLIPINKVTRWIADKVSGWEDHYQFVAQKSVLKRAISKPVLTARGLISYLDYYLERHALKIS